MATLLSVLGLAATARTAPAAGPVPARESRTSPAVPAEVDAPARGVRVVRRLGSAPRAFADVPAAGPLALEVSGPGALVLELVPHRGEGAPVSIELRQDGQPRGVLSLPCTATAERFEGAPDGAVPCAPLVRRIEVPAGAHVVSLRRLSGPGVSLAARVARGEGTGGLAAAGTAGDTNGAPREPGGRPGSVSDLELVAIVAAPARAAQEAGGTGAGGSSATGPKVGGTGAGASSATGTRVGGTGAGARSATGTEAGGTGAGASSATETRVGGTGAGASSATGPRLGGTGAGAGSGADGSEIGAGAAASETPLGTRAPDAGAPAPGPGPLDSFWHRLPGLPGVWAPAAGGVVALGVGSYLALSSRSSYARARGDVTQVEARRLNDQGATQAKRANVALGIGAVGLAAALVVSGIEVFTAARSPAPGGQ